MAGNANCLRSMAGSFNRETAVGRHRGGRVLVESADDSAQRDGRILEVGSHLGERCFVGSELIDQGGERATIIGDAGVASRSAVAEATQDGSVSLADEDARRFERTVGGTGLVQVGNRGDEGGQGRSPELADGGVAQPCVGTDEHPAEDGGRTFGEVDEADDARVIEARQEVCLVTEPGAACRVIGLIDGDESIVVVAEREILHEVVAIIIMKHETA